MRLSRLLRATLLAVLALPLFAQHRGVWALTGGTVHPVASPAVEGATVVLRDGLIEAVGAGIPIPADATTIDVTGLHVYPALFDAHTALGLPAATGQGAVEPTAASSAAQLLNLTEEARNARRAIGVAVVLAAPRGGTFNGQSVILSLGDGDAASQILKAPASMHYAYATKSWGNFPDSLMGAVHHLRQTLIDAKWLAEARAVYERDPRGKQRPVATPALEALAPVLRREIPLVISADSELLMERSATLAREAGVRWVVSGAAEAWESADLLARAGAPVLFAVDYPKKPEVNPEDQSLAAIRDRVNAPKGPAELAKRKVTFALVSGPALEAGGFVPGIRKAIEQGLGEEDALRAVTLTPAAIFGIDRQIGSLERGKIANVLVTEKKFWEKDAKVRRLFIDGREVRLPKEAPPAEGAAASPVAGSWNLTIRTPEGEIALQLTLSVSGGTVSGTYSGDRGSGSIREGSVEGSSVRFSLTAQTAPGGETSDWNFSGTVTEGTMTGEVSTTIGTFPFTGRKPE